MKIKSLLIAATALPLVATSLTSCGNQSGEVNQQLKEIAEMSNSSCPIQVAPGMTLDSVVYADNAIKYHYLVTDMNFAAIENNPMQKEGVVNQLQSLGFEDIANILCENNCSLVYEIYTSDSRTMQMVLSPEELKKFFSGTLGTETKTRLLQNLAKSEQANLPLVISEDITMSSVKFENNVYQYEYLASDRFMANIDAETAKNQSMANLRHMPNFKQTGELFIATNTLLRYRYTTPSGKNLDVEITTAEMQTIIQDNPTASDAKDVLENEAKVTNANCPTVIGDGSMTLVSVTYSDDKFRYLYTITDNHIIMDVSDEDLKQSAINVLKQEALTATLVASLINAEASLVYSYQTKSGKVRDIILSPEELQKHIGVKSQSALGLELTAKTMDEQCPFDEHGMTFVNVSYEKRTFQATIQATDNELGNTAFKTEAQESIKQFILDGGHLLQWLVDENAKAVFKFQSKSGKHTTIEISNRELRELN